MPKKPPATLGIIYRMPLEDLHPHPLNPYGVRDDSAMQELVGSVKENGVLIPAIARPRKEGGYELISGHRRKYACEQLGQDTMPVMVLNLKDDDAIIRMIDSNIQRENILPSERAKAYKLKMEAVKRKAGRPQKDDEKNSPKISANFRSDDSIGDQEGISGDTIRNYISLTNLTPPLMQMVDDGKIALSPAYQLASLNEKEQELLVETIGSEQSTPSLSQAQRMKKLSQSGERFQKITSAHIERVLEGIADNRTQVRNTKAYLLAALFNSVSTIDHYYTMQYNHDYRCPCAGGQARCLLP